MIIFDSEAVAEALLMCYNEVKAVGKRKKLMICISCALAAVIVTAGVCLFVHSKKPKTYSTAKTECEKVLVKHGTELESLSAEVLETGNPASGYYDSYFYSCHQEDSFVTFEIDGQGMLGGQYWSLVYTKDGTFYGETESYLYEQPDGNNIVKAERLDAHWWYLWTDYDGTERSYQ